MIDKTEEEIMKSWGNQFDKPLVTICSITFNHENYIEQALDSFLIQETSFPFEIIVHDDLSTDNTSAIIQQYEEKYPKIIKPIYQKENQYSKGIRAISPIFVFPKAKGKYLTLCEGDDYWTGISKLEQQVEFLENNNNYSLCYHNSTVVDENSHLLEKMKHASPKDYTVEEMLLGETFILTNTIMFRNFTPEILKGYQVKYKEVFNGDMALMHQLGFMGKCKYLEEVDFAAYRVHSGGVWSSINEVKKIENIYKSKRVLEKNLLDYPELEAKMDSVISHHFSISLSRILLLRDLKSYSKVIQLIKSDNRLSLFDIVVKHIRYIFSRIIARVPLVGGK